MEKAVPIEEKQLKGIILKTIYAIIIGTASIVFTVFGTYSSLSGQITKMQFQKDSDARYNDLRMKTLEQKVDALQIMIENMKKP